MKRLVPFAVCIMLTPVTMRAQISTLQGSALSTSAPIGNVIQAPLRFQGENVPTNQVSLTMGASFVYDDNVFNENPLRIGDDAAQFNSHFSFVRHTENLAFNFDYSPSFFLFRNTSQLNRLNHAGSLDMEYRFSPRWVFGLSDGGGYLDGIFQSFSGQPITSGLGSPTALNQSIFPYTVRTLSNSSGLNLIFLKSRRTSIEFSGDYNLRQFGSGNTTGQSFYNGRSASGGLQYQYRVTEHTSVGLSAIHEDSTYKGGTALGSLQRFQTETALLALSSRLAPTVTVGFFAGPQYVTTFGELPGVKSAAHLEGAGAGSLTKEVRRTALDITAQRIVSDSGGIYGLVESTQATLGIRQRLGHWETSLRSGATRIETLNSPLGNGRADGVTSSLEFERPFSDGTTFRISYQNSHQLTSGTLPISANFDLDMVTIGVDFRLKARQLGH